MLLEIHVEEGCLGCERALELAAWARQRFPGVAVDLIDASRNEGRFRHLVTATPSYVLDGEVIALGNPSQAELEKAVSLRVSLRYRRDEPSVQVWPHHGRGGHGRGKPRGR